MRLAILPAMAALGLMLGGCTDKATLDLSTRPAIPALPADLATCFAKTFPKIPDAAFGPAAAVRIITSEPYEECVSRAHYVHHRPGSPPRRRSHVRYLRNSPRRYGHNSFIKFLDGYWSFGHNSFIA